LKKSAKYTVFTWKIPIYQTKPYVILFIALEIGFVWVCFFDSPKAVLFA